MREYLVRAVDEGLVKAVFSKDTADSVYKKVRVDYLSDLKKYQFSLFTVQQVFHENYLDSELVDPLVKYSNMFRQIQLYTKSNLYTINVSKKGKVHVSSAAITTTATKTHNQVKNYLISDTSKYPVLKDLGIVDVEGNLVKKMLPKFRQINKFLEVINDTIKNHQGKSLRIVDFGCGKSYLTFIVYDYLVNDLGYDVNIIGLDLKKSVIDNCLIIKDKYSYHNLDFKWQDIKDFDGGNIDMMMSMHACDTATDLALYQALKWKCKYILSVPCCQNEVYRQIKNNSLSFILDENILKERFSAIFTDSIRVEILKAFGYKTTTMEYIDENHSLKNIMIKAIKTKEGEVSLDNIDKILKQYNVSQTLFSLVNDDVEIRK